MPGQNHHQPEDEYRYQHQSRVEQQLLGVHHQAMAQRRLRGVVHDPTARYMGGVAGCSSSQAISAAVE